MYIEEIKEMGFEIVERFSENKYYGIVRMLCGHLEKRNLPLLIRAKNKYCKNCRQKAPFKKEDVYKMILDKGYSIIKYSKEKIIVKDGENYLYSISSRHFYERQVVRKDGKMERFSKANIFREKNLKNYIEINFPLIKNVSFNLKNSTKNSTIKFEDSFGYKYCLSLSNFLYKNIKEEFSSFESKNIFTVDNINLWLKNNKKNFSLSKNQRYINAKSNLLFLCFDCKTEFENTWDKVYCGQFGCKNCFCLEHVYPELSKDWDYEKNSPLTPRDVFGRSGIKYWWICPKCKESYDATPANRTGEAMSACPRCKRSKGQDEIKNILTDEKISFIEEFRFKNCKYKRTLPFDFFLPEYNLCIEFQGSHHYRPISIFGGKESFELQKIKDRIKRNFCENNGMELLEIKYTKIKSVRNIIMKKITELDDEKLK